MAKVTELLGGLSEMEETAARIYWKAALAVNDDDGLRELLKGLALEEEGHMRMIAGFMRTGGAEGFAGLDLDEDAIARTRDYLYVAEKRIDAGRLTNANLIDCVATTESSEWNREFLKVMEWGKSHFMFSISDVAAVQQHKRTVERFLASRPGFERFLSGMRSLPQVWDEKLLVVDDDEALAGDVAALLRDEGQIDIVANGAEALLRIGSGYYAAIVSDYSMPLVNGMELLSRAEKMFPGIGGRFLFFTSDEDMVDFFRGMGLRAVLKRENAAEVSGEVALILGRHS